MGAQFVQDGMSIDYTPGADVAAGAVVVQNDLVGVAVRPIAANQQGSLAVAGIFDFPKSTAGGSAIGAGVTVYWNAAAQQATATAAGNKLLGKTTRAAADADATVRVRMSQ
ncbi:capsid cement protein [Fontivita pretiosa]|uniref:capsid cement protein n=1 Tax=Fontivita pretiosa TaxID=2989684 RepID=UPI003D17B535